MTCTKYAIALIIINGILVGESRNPDILYLREMIFDFDEEMRLIK